MNSIAICPIACLPVRSRPAHSAEMVTQALFGEQLLVLSKGHKWCQVQCCWDAYTGWVSTAQICFIHADEPMSSIAARSLEPAQPAVAEDRFLIIPMGSRLPLYDGLRFTLANTHYQFSGLAIDPLEIIKSDSLMIKIVRRYLHTPYMWGGRSPFGIDCSGFVQVVFLCLGINLPRDASQQAMNGELVNFVSESRVGDLAFFEDAKEQITHVGIVLEDQKIIHASGQVRIDSLDHQGIYNQELRKYTHKLRFVKRIPNWQSAANA